MYMYICMLRFLKQIHLGIFFNSRLLLKINNKKNLFFKKKHAMKVLVSKRLSFILRKRKKLKKIKSKKVDNGNFFFKKFFYKTLLKSIKFLRLFFFFNKKTRQRKITKTIFRNQKHNYMYNNNSYEYALYNIILRSHFCLFLSDVIFLIKNNYIYLNGVVVTQHNTTILVHDFIQLKINKHIYNYIQFSKKFLKKKLALFRLNSWKFFKQKLFKQQQQLKTQKRKTPKYLYLFFLFKLNTPKYIEYDFSTLSICVLRYNTNDTHTPYYFNKLFSYKLFPLYNFKKIN